MASKEATSDETGTKSFFLIQKSYAVIRGSFKQASHHQTVKSMGLVVDSHFCGKI